MGFVCFVLVFTVFRLVPQSLQHVPSPISRTKRSLSGRSNSIGVKFRTKYPRSRAFTPLPEYISYPTIKQDTRKDTLRPRCSRRRGKRTPHRRAVTRRWPYKRRIPVNDVRASTLLSHESGLRRSFLRFTTIPNNLSPLVPLDFPCFSLRTTLSNLVSAASSRFHRSRYAGTRVEHRLPTIPQILQSI